MKTNISKLKILTGYLVDRDLIRVQIVELFDSFCNNFPIDFSAWVSNYDLNLLSVRGYRDNKEENFKNIKDIFKEGAREIVIDKHRLAINGSVETFIINENQKYHLIKIIPSRKRSIIFGISMDVTSIVNLIIIGEKACISNPDCDTLSGLHKNLKNDNLYKLIKKFIEVEL
tara:strand:+ start:6938 stop:7453 length:516 start_codon:yes stop_codon:yes gene_type:complete